MNGMREEKGEKEKKKRTSVENKLGQVLIGLAQQCDLRSFKPLLKSAFKS